ncbi:hypothetical protein COK_2169 [Mannheimia haemolytica serotype A2 str. BOVINE]|nr:hypothetical protein COK_2169 [Mannheimia haemolytica serotype A2 str. BOVINE]
MFYQEQYVKNHQNLLLNLLHRKRWLLMLTLRTRLLLMQLMFFHNFHLRFYMLYDK